MFLTSFSLYQDRILHLDNIACKSRFGWWTNKSTDHQNDPGHAVTGQGRHHDEVEATHDPQLQVGSPVPRNNIHSPRCVLFHGTGNVG